MGISVVRNNSCVVPLGRDGLIFRNMLWFVCCWTPSIVCGVLDSFMVLPSISGLANVTPAFTWQICWSFALIRAVVFLFLAYSFELLGQTLPHQLWMAWLTTCCPKVKSWYWTEILFIDMYQYRRSGKTKLGLYFGLHHRYLAVESVFFWAFHTCSILSKDWLWVTFGKDQSQWPVFP